MFQAMRRVVECLAHECVGEGGFERAIRQSFLGIVPLETLQVAYQNNALLGF